MRIIYAQTMCILSSRATPNFHVGPRPVSVQSRDSRLRSRRTAASLKICCHEANFSNVEVVLGGTAALHTYRVWGAVLFLITSTHDFGLTTLGQII